MPKEWSHFIEFALRHCWNCAQLGQWCEVTVKVLLTLRKMWCSRYQASTRSQQFVSLIHSQALALTGAVNQESEASFSHNCASVCQIKKDCNSNTSLLQATKKVSTWILKILQSRMQTCTSRDNAILNKLYMAYNSAQSKQQGSWHFWNSLLLLPLRTF